MKKEMLEFSYMPLVKAIYAQLDDQTCQVMYQEIEEKQKNLIKNTKNNLGLIRLKIVKVIQLLLHLLSIIGILLITSLFGGLVIGIIHGSIHESSFLLFCDIGEKIYTVISDTFSIVNAQELIMEGAKKMATAGTTGLIENSAYLLFYALGLTLVILSIWLVVFTIKVVNTKEIVLRDKEWNLKKALLILGCNEYDGLSYVKTQLEKRYIKNRLDKQKIHDCIQAYVYIIKNKEFVSTATLDKKSKTKLYFKVSLRCCIYILNLVSKGLVIGTVFLIIYYRFIESFITMGYLSGLWNSFENIHTIFKGGIFTSFSMYHQFTYEVQVVISVVFLIIISTILLQCNQLVRKPAIRFKTCYKNYLLTIENNEKANTCKDTYNIPWLLICIIAGIIVWLSLMLDK